MVKCNDANQVISRTSGATTVTMDYDGNGNLITETAGASIWAYTYDYENRLTVHNIPGTSNDMVLTYDALSRRIMKNVNSGTSIEKYLYDGQNVVADYNNSDVCQASYVTPFLDHNLLVSRTDTVYYYLHDGLGSVRTIIDTSSTMRNSYDYAPDGVVKSGAVENISNRYKFTGREHDTQGNMYNYRARMYKPGSGQQGGRFMQRDPIGYAGGLNIYSYCGNNPVNYTDPMGLEPNTSAGHSEETSEPPADLNDKLVKRGGDYYDPLPGGGFRVHFTKIDRKLISIFADTSSHLKQVFAQLARRGISIPEPDDYSYSLRQDPKTYDKNMQAYTAWQEERDAKSNSSDKPKRPDLKMIWEVTRTSKEMYDVWMIEWYEDWKPNGSGNFVLVNDPDSTRSATWLGIELVERAAVATFEFGTWSPSSPPPNAQRSRDEVDLELLRRTMPSSKDPLQFKTTNVKSSWVPLN